jgi:hypothetical protein
MEISNGIENALNAFHEMETVIFIPLDILNTDSD